MQGELPVLHSPEPPQPLFVSDAYLRASSESTTVAFLLFGKKVEAAPRKVRLFQDSSGAAAPPPDAVLLL